MDCVVYTVIYQWTVWRGGSYSLMDCVRLGHDVISCLSFETIRSDLSDLFCACSNFVYSCYTVQLKSFLYMCMHSNYTTVLMTYVIKSNYALGRVFSVHCDSIDNTCIKLP